MRLPAILLAPVVALALVACGGGDDEGGGGPPARLAAGEPFRVAAGEYSFDPAEAVVPRPGRVEIDLDNTGSLAHNVRVFEDDRDVGGTPTLPAGEKGSGTLRLGAGTYELRCTVGDHAQLGMTGTLRVKE